MAVMNERYALALLKQGYSRCAVAVVVCFVASMTVVLTSAPGEALAVTHGRHLWHRLGFCMYSRKLLQG